MLSEELIPYLQKVHPDSKVYRSAVDPLYIIVETVVGSSNFGQGNIVPIRNIQKLHEDSVRLELIRSKQSIKEHLLLTALKNNVRQENFKELYDLEDGGHITYEELEQRLESTPDKYVVQIKNEISTEETQAIVDIMSELQQLKEFTTSDVEILFGIKSFVVEEAVVQFINKPI